MIVTRRQVELLEKNKPRQARAKRTYEGILSSAAELLVEVEGILSSAAELLVEVGVERISTNIIAERAGITVPALYRYFPNKYAVLNALGYAVLNALGAVLMDRQNEVFQQWFETHLPSANPQVLIDRVYDLLKMTYDVTREQTGGLEIIQSLRAVGPLQELRLTSHRLVAEQFAAALSELLGRPVDEEMSLQRGDVSASSSIGGYWLRSGGDGP
jgi:AcrR family transcriptional regulator